MEDGIYTKRDKYCYDKIENAVKTLFSKKGEEEWKNYISEKKRIIIKNDDYFWWECNKTCITYDPKPIFTIKNKTADRIEFTAEHIGRGYFFESENESKTDSSEFIIVKVEDEFNNSNWKIEKIPYMGD